MKNRIDGRKNFARKSIFRILWLCCGGGDDNEINPDMDNSNIRQSSYENVVVKNCQPNVSTTQPVVSVDSTERLKRVKWKAETRVAEWRAAAIALREGQITEINPKSFKKIEVARYNKSLLKDEAKMNVSVNSKHTIKFKQGALEKNFFEHMELPEPNKTGKTLVWNILIKQTC